MDLMTFADAVDVETAMAWAASIQDDQPEESEGDEKKKPLTIEEMLAYGIGVVGLSIADWCDLSPEEFSEVCRAYNEVEEQRLQGEWERMRLLATMTIQPHVKSKLNAKRLLPLPWDGPKRTEFPNVNKEEARKRFETFVRSEATL